MNRTMKLALSTILGTMLVGSAFAQAFPDTPDNHWAYEAVEHLKQEGILVGYPDGLYRGNRQMTRYEFAAALHAAYKKLMGMMEGMQGQIDALEEMIETGGSRAELQALRDKVAELERAVNGMRGWGDEIAMLKRMADEFEKELAEMGVNVNNLRTDLNALEDRVAALEKRKPAVDIHGDVNLLVLGGHASDNDFGMTQGGRLLGVGRDSYAGAPVGMTRDLTVLHEAALKLTSTNDSGPKWQATLVAGNMLGNNGLIDYNNQGLGVPFSEPNTSVYFYDFFVDLTTSLLGQNFDAKIGRVGHQVGEYLWKRNDFTTYFANDRWDNGNFIFDGGILSFNFGNVGLNVFGGRNSDRNATNGTDLNPIAFGAGTIDATLGVEAKIGLGENGSVKLAYLWHDSNTQFLTNNRVNVYGAEVNFGFQNFDFTGKFAQSTVGENTSNNVDRDNTAWDLALAYNQDRWGVGVGFRRVEGNFVAAGSWGRFGTEWNPGNFEGFNAMLNFRPTDNIRIYAMGEFVEGVKNGVFLNSLPITTNDKVNTFTVGLDYDINEAWTLGLSYEDVRFNYNVGTDPHQRWFNFGLGWNMAENAMLSINYLFSDVDFRGRQAAFGFANSQYRGGLLSTQATIKF
jgi:BMFP domain-containing protein YqiC